MLENQRGKKYPFWVMHQSVNVIKNLSVSGEVQPQTGAGK
jgi:hypothetical protein